MSIFQAVILGMVQGVAEFLPISSSGHLVLVPYFFKWKDPGLAFDVFLHFGTLLAVCAYFFRDWLSLIKAGIASIVERKIGFERERFLFWAIVVATIPGVIVGMTLAKYAEEHFRDPMIVAIALAAVGFLLYWIDGKYSALKNVEEIKMSDALLIGIAQSAAVVFPGVSRSGATMTMARFRGFSRESAARFSFLMSVPITAGACLYEAKGFLKAANFSADTYLIAGFLSSFLFGLVAIHFLLQWLRSADFRVFAWYRLALAIVIIIVTLVR